MKARTTKQYLTQFQYMVTQGHTAKLVYSYTSEHSVMSINTHLTSTRRLPPARLFEHASPVATRQGLL